MKWELKLDSGKVVEWDGKDEIDAATRFVDSERVAGREVAVVATRRAAEYGVSVLGRGGRIIG